MSEPTSHRLDPRTVAVIKGLVMDQSRAANSGHPGGAMSSADALALVFSEFLNYDPDDPGYFDRDRFVLSPGHESALLYAALHLVGHLELDDLRAFRQYGSRTPGHPEVGVTPSVEATTGPLGQGVAMGVGMASAEAHLRALLGSDVCDHFTYVLCSDGDLQEGVAMGACSLAGLWQLSRLVLLYDSNKVQLAGQVCACDCTDYAKVFAGMCWHVQEVDGHDHAALRSAVMEAKLDTRPSLIICHTTMAKGAATREGDFTTHGSPLPEDEIAATKAKLGLPEGQFVSDDAAKADMRARHEAMRQAAAAWKGRLEARLAADPDFAARWDQVRTGARAVGVEWPQAEEGASIATRKAWGMGLDGLARQLETLVGGSADLDPSNQTMNFRKTYGEFSGATPMGRNLCFGVREFPMAAIANGIALHGGLTPFTATFLSFSDYMRGAIRMSALQELPVLHVFTHDSFAVGEDGPTHQPIEHVSALRLIPNLLVFRPADARETWASLEIALGQAKRPSCLILTRQGLPVLAGANAEGVARGGYVVQDCEGEPRVVILASGSEVSLAIAAAGLIDAPVRVVSVPCMELLAEQDSAYVDALLGPDSALRVGLEAGRPELWYRWVGRDGLVIGMDHFGHSAPAKRLAEEYGFTPEQVARRIRTRLGL